MVDKIYGPFDSTTTFIKGNRVEICPSTDLWMAGARFGTVTAIYRKKVGIRLDALNRVVKFPPDLIGAIVD